MSKPYADREVWFLTGSQDLYGDDTLRQVAEQSQEIARAIGAADQVPVEIVWKPVLKSSDAIRRMALEANADDACIGVIAWMHTFSPAKMWIAGLDALRTPLLHLHTQANVELPWATIDMDFMNLNQAAHGDREFGYIQTRLGVARRTVVGHVSSPIVQAKVGTWVRAAAGWAALHELRLAGFGFGAEGDWKTAILVRAAKVMGQGLPGGASLMEDYTYNLVPGEEKILGAHMLEICPTLTSSRPSLEIHPLGIGGREDPVRLVFDTDPGPAVVVALSDMRDRFRLTANAVDVVPPDAPLPNLPVAHVRQGHH